MYSRLIVSAAEQQDSTDDIKEYSVKDAIAVNWIIYASLIALDLISATSKCRKVNEYPRNADFDVWLNPVSS